MMIIRINTKEEWDNITDLIEEHLREINFYLGFNKLIHINYDIPTEFPTEMDFAFITTQKIYVPYKQLLKENEQIIAHNNYLQAKIDKLVDKQGD